MQIISASVVKLTAASGDAFFVRIQYLHREGLAAVSLLFTGYAGEIGSEAWEDITAAAQCYEAEKLASSLLCRAEQSRQGLMQKLDKKGASKESAKRALDYLEKSGELSDERFARAYLASRRYRADGRKKMAAMLKAKGIKRREAEAALDEFFKEHPEEDLCRKALAKGIKQGKSGEELAASLVRKGFPCNMVRRVMKE